MATNTGSDIDYGNGSVANQKLDILINGSTIADDVAFSNNQLADAFESTNKEAVKPTRLTTSLLSTVIFHPFQNQHPC